MTQLKRIFDTIIGNLYIPDEILHLNGPTLLHLSDTPTMLYPGIKKLIERLKPDYIIHTGDLVDNLKLELYPNRLKEYAGCLKKLSKILNASSAKLYLTIGNHDDLSTVKYLFGSAEIITEEKIVDIEGVRLNISHYPPKQFKPSVDYYLFGHDLSLLSQKTNDHYLLNGIEYIYIVELNSHDVTRLSFPNGTNDSRMNKGKLGI
jgi:predicted MPP superfamily phosphohydrolase